MSAHWKSRKLAPLAGVLSLMALSACGGLAAGASHPSAASSLSEAANVAGAHKSAASKSVTIYACLTAGKLTRVSTTAPKCPAKSVLVRWTGQSSSAAPVKAKSSPTPTSTPGKTTSAPTAPTATATAPGGTTQGTACVTSVNNGTCGPYTFSGISGGGQTEVIQDVWNPISGAAQTLTAFNPGDWSVSAKMPAGNTAVVSYPDTQQLYTTTSNTPDPLSNFSSITSSYAESGPSASGDDYEAAYDIWAGTGSSDYAQEIMIWVDNHGQRPAGSDVASATIDGVGYKIWSTGGAGAVGHPVSMVLDSNESSGSVNVLDDLKWLESSGYMPAGSGLNQIDFGYEICSTGGVAQTFTLSGYGIKSA
jgi:hypothetical protein